MTSQFRFIGVIVLATALGVCVGLLARPTLALLAKMSAVKDGKQIERKRSPRGENEAVVRLPIVDGLGATISQPFEVSVLKVGETSSEEVVLAADKTESISIAWLDDQRLIICYGDAKIRHFHNYWQFVERADASGPRLREVEVILIKTPNKGECGKSQ